jgi:hypothetical protein
LLLLGQGLAIQELLLKASKFQDLLVLRVQNIKLDFHVKKPFLFLWGQLDGDLIQQMNQAIQVHLLEGSFVVGIFEVSPELSDHIDLELFFREKS